MKMKRETQALHLARIMQKHIHTPSYELALGMVMVSKKRLKKLSEDDLLLCGFERLELMMIDGETICAQTRLIKTENQYQTEVLNLLEDTIEQSNSKKYEVVKLSFGKLQIKRVEPGKIIDITDIDLQSVDLVVEGKTIAQGSLVIVDEEIVVQIKRVN